MAHLWNLIQEQLATNQFLSGGFVLMVTAALGALLRKVPSDLWNWLKHRAFVEVEIPMRDDAFLWFNDWLAEQSYTKKRARSLTVRSVKKSDESKRDVKMVFSPAVGTHWLWWKGYFVVVNRTKKNPPGAGSQPTLAAPDQEAFNISILAWRRDAVINLLKEAYDVANPSDDDRISVYVGRYGRWENDLRRKPRPLNTVVFRKGLLEEIVEDVKRFRSRESWYQERGVPYHRTYFFHGPPGNGKSSAVLAIASELKHDICILNLASPGISDDELASMFSSVPESAVVLIEDIDCMFNDRKKVSDNESRMSFSGLLNAIDGVASAEGRILFITTNHPEKLDPALLRDGRCDLKRLIPNADADQAERLFLRFFPGHQDHASKFGELVGHKDFCMAALQGYLVKHSDDPQLAVSHTSEIKNEPTKADEGSERTRAELGVQATTTDGEVAESEALHQDDQG